MARLLFEMQGIRRRNGQLANGVALTVYTDEAGTALADISATSGGSAIPGSTVTTADIAGLGPASLRFWGPTDATDILYLRAPADASLGVQKIEADPDPRLDLLEAGVTSGLGAHEADTTAIHGITDTAQLETLNTNQTVSGEKTHTGHQYFTTGRPQVDCRAFPTVKAAIDDAATPTNALYHIAAGFQDGGGAITLPRGVTLQGDVALDQTGVGSIVNFSGGDGFVLTDGGAVEFNRLVIAGADRCVVALGGAVTHTTFRNVHIAAASGSGNACIYTDGDIERWYMDHVFLQGGDYGFQHANVARAGGNYIDKSTFKDVLTGGQDKNGWRLEGALFNSLTWLNPIINTADEHGFYLDGGARGLLFVDLNTEANGLAGKSNRTTLTGTVGAGATSGTLASATGWANGDPIVIRRAGVDKRDHFATVNSLAGTAVGWTPATVEAVTAPKVTNAKWDDFHFPSIIGTPSEITFVGGILGEGGGHLRYGIYSTAFYMAVVGLSGADTTPIYDPEGRVQLIGARCALRRPPTTPSLLATEAAMTTNDEQPYSLALSPSGGDYVIHLRDSADNETGSLGNFKIHLGSAGRPEILAVQSDGDLAHWGLNSSSVAYFAQKFQHGGAAAGFFGTTPVAKPTVTGSQGANAALISLIDALAALGLITDSAT